MFKQLISTKLPYLYGLLVFILCFINFGVGYQTPNAPIWDEGYYASAAEKYLTNTFFMESHPPLGKLFIALGEKVINPNVAYDDLKPAARFCLANTSGIYKETGADGKVNEIKEVKLADGTTRPMTLLDVREKTKVAIDKSSFTKTNQVGSNNSSFDDNYSFCGIRLVPVAFSIGCGVLFYVLIYLLTKRATISFLLSFFYIFENIFQVHFRAAMLDSIQLFFILATFIIAIKLFRSIFVDHKPMASRQLNYALLGLMIGLGVATKHNGLFLGVLPVLLLASEYYYVESQKSVFEKLSTDIGDMLIKLAKNALVLGFAAFSIYLAVFYIHGSIGYNIANNESESAGYYKASNTYKDILKEQDQKSVANLGVILQDNIKYMDEYHRSVPKFKGEMEGENGSEPYKWLVMGKTIRYRVNTFFDGKVKTFYYSYLIGNPVNWYLGLFGLILAVIIIARNRVKAVDVRNKFNYYMLILFSAMYVIYMSLIVYTFQARVMYLYHYIIALALSYVISALVVNHIISQSIKINMNRTYKVLAVLAIISVASWALYSPLTYNRPVRDRYLKTIPTLPIWKLDLSFGMN